MSKPAFTRLPVDERRRRLLDLGAGLFATHAFDQLSMAAIAREAGISKALLYHYFPSKEAYFVATLEQQAGELRALTHTDPSRPAAEQIATTLDAFLTWVEAHGQEYRNLLRSAGSVPQVGAVVEDVRRMTVERLLDGLGHTGDPRARIAAQGWIGFMNAAIADWLEHRDVERPVLQALLLDALRGALP